MRTREGRAPRRVPRGAGGLAGAGAAPPLSRSPAPLAAKLPAEVGDHEDRGGDEHDAGDRGAPRPEVALECAVEEEYRGEVRRDVRTTSGGDEDEIEDLEAEVAEQHDGAHEYGSEHRYEDPSVDLKL